MDRARQAARVARPRAIEDVVAFELSPAVVPAPDGRRLEVHLLPVVLPDIGEVEIPGLAVERPAPGVPDALRPELVLRARRSVIRIAGRHRVGRAPVHVDPQELPE